MTAPLHLDAKTIEAIADAVADRLRAEPPVESPLLSAGEVADRLGVGRDAIYRRAAEFGAVRIGDAVRFRRSEVERALDATARSSSEESLTPERRPRRRRRNGQTPDLLPIRGRHPDA